MKHPAINGKLMVLRLFITSAIAELVAALEPPAIPPVWAWICEASIPGKNANNTVCKMSIRMIHIEN